MNTNKTQSMTTAEIKALADQFILNTYGERRLALVKGNGVSVWDAEGNEYLDFFAGIAVVSLGHCHPEVTQAICEQAQKLVHVSNLYYIEPQVRLAQKLAQHSFACRWFFCNCGATANEAALKLARRYWAQKGTPKPRIIAMQQSFHGRTFAALTATGQQKYHQGFEPLMPEIHATVPFGDIDALEQSVTPTTGAVILEPIQGEGGVRIPPPGYLRAVREICSKHGILMILDEVQTGMGRTGKLFAYEHEEIAPDIITLAKALGNGVPIGAVGCTEEVASGFSPGMHASTFGGNPLCTAAALATLDVILRDGFLQHVQDIGNYFLEKLRALQSKYPLIREVRGKGLMIGVECTIEVKPIVDKMIDARILCGPAGSHVLRFVPPLVVNQEHVDTVINTLDKVLGAM